MAEKNSLNRVVIYNLLGKIILNGINFIVLPFFTRLLGTENFARFSLYLAWESIVTIVVTLQTPSIIGNVTMRYGKKTRMEIFLALFHAR